MSGGTEAEKRKLRSILRQIRQEANVRQIDLAEKLAKPQSFISKYELGEQTLDFFEVKGVCEALNMSMYELIKKLE